MRLDKYLQAKYPEYSRTDLQKIIAEGKVLLHGKALQKNFRVETANSGCPEPEIEILQMPVKEESFLEPENIPLNIVFEDEHLAVINKPKDMIMHPGNGISKGTLAAALLWHFKNSLSQINGPLRPGILHRLDKDTPGLLVVAKTDFAHKELTRQLETRALERTYRAVIWGVLRDREGEIDAPIERDQRNRLKMAVQPKGKSAITNYKTLETFSIASYVEFKLDTGRTHQIRVHARYLGNPVVGDPLYDGREESAKRIDPIYKTVTEKLLEAAKSQTLQSYKIKFMHPQTENAMEFEIPPDESLNDVLCILRNEVKAGASFPLQLFEPPQVFANPEDIEIEPEKIEEEPVKERLTRAERYAAAKIRRALKKERELLRLREREQ